MKAISILILLSILSFANAQPDCSVVYPTISQDGKYIYFSSTLETDNYQIYRSDITGGNVIRITFSDKDDLFPDISPDENWLVFQRGKYGGGAEIYILHLNGMELSRLTNNNVYDGQPKFSPYSDKIIYSAWDDSPYPEIFTMDLYGNNKKQITADPGVTWHHRPMYSPDEKYIYFAYGENADNRIIKMTADGTTWKDITLPNSFGHDEADFDIFDNGDKLIIQTTEYHGFNKGTDLIYVNSDGSGWERITTGNNYEYFYSPCLNPNNSDNSIYFAYCQNINENNKFVLKRMDYNGTNTKTLFECHSLAEKDISLGSENWLFPNPASDYIYLSSDIPVEIKEIMITNITGDIIIKQNNIKALKYINTSSLKAGIYIVEFLGNNNTRYLSKLIIY